MYKILVTGGAGYIGSHTVRALKRAGYQPVIYDNFSRGHRAAVRGFTVIEGDTWDKKKLCQVMKKYTVAAVMHFAAHSQVGESQEKPALYYENNIGGGLKLLESMLEVGVKFLIFSSSAAVYGEPQQVPITEEHPLQPLNPYGETKAVLERALAYYDQAYDLRSTSLRYFNAAGAAEEGGIGECHEPETHLIPLVIEAALGKNNSLIVFGNDYPTNDGTAVRDYIHVEDLADAHILALEALLKGSQSIAYNLGNGKGYSVLEVIKAVEKVTKLEVPYNIGPRRAGDSAVLVASAEKAETELGWQPKFDDLEVIIKSAYHWHRNHFSGYGN